MSRWLRDTTGGLPRTFWYLWFGTLINRAGGFVIVFMTIYLTTVRDLSATQAGLVMGLWAGGGAFGTMLGGIAADRIGRKVTLLTGQVAGAAILLAMAFVTGLPALAALAFALGFFAESARPASSAMLIDIVGEPDRLRAFTLNYWAVNVGFALAATLAGLAAGLDPHLLFIVDAATTFATALFIFVKVPETGTVRRQDRRNSSRVGPIERGPGLREVFRDRVFLTFVGLNLFVAFVFMQHLTTLPIAMTRDGLSSQTYGLVIGLNGLLIVCGQLFIPKLLAGRSRSHLLAAAAVVMGVGFGLTAFAATPVFYAMTVLIWTVGEMINAPANSTLVAALSPSQMRGRYQGVLNLSWAVAGFAAPVLGGWVQDHVGNSQLWLGCAVIGVVVAVAQVASGPARERRAEALAT
ncbi:MFS family permease [Allocatelliglobosispora scoriae]|uniref:MFS family permease n=1 Tax=Allocatelliglobosispora scoriae TaxID=643052 RepID=A0A841BVD5_9ACTN|nr:MFS transporter [Allocatelliglobosispora scoriae]MBB5871426.1 MFS family permease [Allocatelliglobosispora scoriae]